MDNETPSRNYFAFATPTVGGSNWAPSEYLFLGNGLHIRVMIVSLILNIA